MTYKYCLYLSKHEHQFQSNDKLKIMHITYIRRSLKILLKLIFLGFTINCYILRIMFNKIEFVNIQRS